jgi:hypothetical protein
MGVKGDFMNADRRKNISDALDKIREGLEGLETAKDEEQDYLDNMPESLQGGDKGQKAEEAISNLEDAISSIEDAISTAESAAE